MQGPISGRSNPVIVAVMLKLNVIIKLCKSCSKCSQSRIVKRQFLPAEWFELMARIFAAGSRFCEGEDGCL